MHIGLWCTPPPLFFSLVNVAGCMFSTSNCPKKVKEMNICHALMGEFSLFFSVTAAVCVRVSCVCYSERDSADAQQKTLCVSPFIRAEEVFPFSSFLSFFVPPFWCRFCFSLMKKARVHEWMLFWAPGLQWAQRRRESWKTCKDVTPLLAEA